MVDLVADVPFDVKPIRRVLAPLLELTGCAKGQFLKL